jgi:hypothetical protein
MRALFGFVAAVAILTMSVPAEAGKSRSLHADGFFAALGATRPFGSGHPTFWHHRHGSGMAFHHRPRRFFRSDPFVGTIVPPLKGIIVPPFQIGRQFHRDRFLSHRFDGFSFGGVGGGGQTIIILQPVPVPVDAPVATRPRVKAQIIELEASPGSTGVQVFTPSFPIE